MNDSALSIGRELVITTHFTLYWYCIAIESNGRPIVVIPYNLQSCKQFAILAHMVRPYVVLCYALYKSLIAGTSCYPLWQRIDVWLGTGTDNASVLCFAVGANICAQEIAFWTENYILSESATTRHSHRDRNYPEQYSSSIWGPEPRVWCFTAQTALEELLPEANNWAEFWQNWQNAAFLVHNDCTIGNNKFYLRRQNDSFFWLDNKTVMETKMTNKNITISQTTVIQISCWYEREN